jgi:hypothetical protein
MSVNVQCCFLFVHFVTFTTCFGLMWPSSGVHPLTDPAALSCRRTQDSAGARHIKKHITTDGTSTYEAEPRGSRTRIECKNGITVQQGPSRDEHLKMAT